VSEPVAVENGARGGGPARGRCDGGRHRNRGSGRGTAENRWDWCFGFHVRGHEDSIQRMLRRSRRIRARASQLALFGSLPAPSFPARLTGRRGTRVAVILRHA
jgi:hypothetical protein